MREKDWESVCVVCVYKRKRERTSVFECETERASVCAWERERKCVYVCVSDRESKCLCEREREIRLKILEFGPLQAFKNDIE